MMVYSFNLISYTVNQSGLTVIGSDVVESGDIITIAVSNVILDLDGNRVRGGDNGIIINSGLSNVTVQNGFIELNTIGLSIKDTCSFITLKNLEISECASRAIEFEGSSGSEITHVTLENIKIDQCSTTTEFSADHVISCVFTQELTMNTITISQCGGIAVDLRAINLVNCDKGVFNNVLINCNTGDTFEGIHIEDTTNMLFDKCTIKMNTADASLIGFEFTGGADTNGNICQDCLVTANSSVSGPLSGFELSPFVTRNTIRTSLVNYNLTTGAVSTAHCYGFNLDQPTFCSIVECNSEYNRATGNGGSNNCAGFNIGTSGGGTTGTKDCQFCSNKAFSNIGFNNARSFGMRVMSSSAAGNARNVFLFNIAGLNGTTTGNQITSTSGAGSSPGGVPSGSITDKTVANLNFFLVFFGNLRIVS